MTIDDRPVTDGRHQPPHHDLPAALQATRDSVVHLLDQCAVPPRSVRVTAGPVSMELDWAEDPGGPPPAAPRPGSAAPAAPAPPAADAVTAPAVGVFYRAPEPGARPFAEPGDVVVPGQRLGLVEAMKLLIPVESDRHGTVVEYLLDNGAAVEFGEPLVLVAATTGD